MNKCKSIHFIAIIKLFKTFKIFNNFGSEIYIWLIEFAASQLQKDREDEKAEGYVPDEGTRKNPRKTTK